MNSEQIRGEYLKAAQRSYSDSEVAELYEAAMTVLTQPDELSESDQIVVIAALAALNE